MAFGQIVFNGLLKFSPQFRHCLTMETDNATNTYYTARENIITLVVFDPGRISFIGRIRRVEYEKTNFPWAASGRALGTGRREGLTKLLVDKETKRILGAGMVGPNSDELIAEALLALEMGADAEDVSLTINHFPIRNFRICGGDD